MDENLFKLDPRRAGDVKRYHAHPCIHPQDVGNHTWNVMRIMTTIWPNCPRELLLYAIYHDITEGVVGDIPYPTKLSSPKMKALCDMLEEEAYMNMKEGWGVPELPKLTPEQKEFFKACELVEFFEYAANEFNMGNTHARIIVQRVVPRIAEYAKTNPMFKEYISRRMEYDISA